MTIQEIWKNAGEIMPPNCRVCRVCNGVACRGEIPGMGAAGDGSSWTASMAFLQRVKLNMDTVYAYHGVDTGLEMFGKTFKYPIFVAPIGIAINTNRAMTEEAYARSVVSGARKADILPFTGDGPQPDLLESGIAAAKAEGGISVPVLKPWKTPLFMERFERVKAAKTLAVGMDIDAAGFVNMGAHAGSISPKSVAEIRELTEAVGMPFVLKGVMTAKGAEKAAEAGCRAIVVSTHGGRVLPSAPATCSVLPEIRAAVGNSLKIIVDGGIRSGADVFKALALGADAAMIGRPFTIAAHGGGAEGVAVYAGYIGEQLRNVMLMCGAGSLADISPEMIRIGD